MDISGRRSIHWEDFATLDVFTRVCMPFPRVFVRTFVRLSGKTAVVTRRAPRVTFLLSSVKLVG